MIKKLLVLFFCFIFPVFSFSQDEKQESEQDEDAYYSLLEKGAINISLDFSNNAVKHKGQKTFSSSLFNIKDFYVPYISLSTGLTDRLTLGADISYRITKANADITLPRINRTIKANKEISGLDLITLWSTVGIIKEHNSRPSIEFNSYFYLPNTGREEYQIENLGFFPELALHNTFGDYFDLYYAGGVSWDGSYAYPVYSFDISPNYTINEMFSVSADFWNSFAKRCVPDNYFTFDISYNNPNNFSIDLYAGSKFQDPKKNLFGGITFNYYFYAF